MNRNIVRIDPDKCDGCGLCVTACAEGAIEIVDGKARLVSDIYCDGLGNCLGECPHDAITIEQRQAEAFDEQAVERRLAGAAGASPCAGGGCPGSAVRAPASRPVASAAGDAATLGNWPVQLALAPPTAPYFDHADLLISADCVAFALPDFHSRLLPGKTTLIACPKLDDRIEAYVQKLTAILQTHDVKSVTVAHMEVPCCTGIVRIVREAIKRAGADALPFRDITVGIDGTIKAES